MSLETELAGALGKVNSKLLKELVRLLGDPPNMINVPADFWTKSEKLLYLTMLPALENAALDGALELINTISIGVDWALVNEAAADWARQYTFTLVGGITKTSRSATQTVVANFFEQQLTIGEMRIRLGRIWGAERAEMIARTEITRAAAEGQRIVEDLLKQYGISAIEIWVTRNDKSVCVICEPRDGWAEGEGVRASYWTRADGPPAHPRCRCGIRHEFERIGE